MITQKRVRSRERWARRLLIASAVLAGWAGVVWVTGGFLLQLGGFRISSRNPSRVTLLAVALAVIAWRLAYQDWLRVRLRQLPSAGARFDRRLSSWATAFVRGAPVLVWTMAAAVIGCGLVFGSRVAGGADAFGYLSESALWRHGRLAVDQSYATSLPWPNALGSFVPLAYRLSADGWMGPTVAPGLPLLMTFAGLFSACGPYLVVPLCGAALVVSTFHLGKRLFGTGTALAASALVACSPVVVFESLVVMADVPAAAMWMSALAVASGTPRATLASGILTGVAILIRPNLLPLALFPWLMSIVRCETARNAATRTGLFAAGSLPAAWFIAWVNQRLYGSPFSSGYGDLGGAFAVSHAAANLRLYTGWWLESQGALGCLFLLALWRRRTRVREFLVLLGYATCTGLMYVFYLPFDQWWYLRFLIPAIPVVFLLAADAVDWAAHRSPSLRVAAVAAFAVAAAIHAIAFMDAKDILGNRVAEQRRYLDGATLRRPDAAARGRGPGDAAQRQRPLLRRTLDDAMGRARPGLARSCRDHARRPRRSGLCADRGVGGSRFPRPILRPAHSRPVDGGRVSRLAGWRAAALRPELGSSTGHEPP